MKDRTVKQSVAGDIATPANDAFRGFAAWAEPPNLEAVCNELNSSHSVRFSATGQLQVDATKLHFHASAMWARAGVNIISSGDLEKLLTGSFVIPSKRSALSPCWKLGVLQWADGGKKRKTYTLGPEWSNLKEAISAAVVKLASPILGLAWQQHEERRRYKAAFEDRSDVDVSDDARRNSGSEAGPSDAIGMPGE